MTSTCAVCGSPAGCKDVSWDLLHPEGDSSRLRQLGWIPQVALHVALSELLLGAFAAARQLVQAPC